MMRYRAFQASAFFVFQISDIVPLAFTEGVNSVVSHIMSHILKNTVFLECKVEKAKPEKTIM